MTNPRLSTLVTASLAAATLAAGLLAAGCASATVPPPDARIAVRTADELPRRTYAVQGPAVELIKDDARFLPLVDAFLADALSDLAAYRIENADALKKQCRGIYQAYLAKGDLASALEYAEKTRVLEPKPSASHAIGSALRARIAAEKETGTRDPDDPRFREVFRAKLREGYSQLPDEVAQQLLATVRNTGAAVTPALLESSIASSMDPQLAAPGGQVTAEVVRQLIDYRDAIVFRVKIAGLAGEVAGEVLAERGAAAPAEDKWTPRLVTLDPSEDASPVVIAIWDTGIDTPIFPGNLWTNPLELPNGIDDDRNGFVDDRHGISFSGGAVPITGNLSSLGMLTRGREEALELFAGRLEVSGGIDTPRARAYQERTRSMSPDELEMLMADMMVMFFHVHGTHVTGVAVDGNPFVRALSVADSSMGAGPSELADPVAYGRKWAEFCKRNIEYLRKANVRVVNMSWANSPHECRRLLEMWNIGGSPEERRRLGREMFTVMRDGLVAAIRSAPEILFLTVAGNEDEDVDFAELIPAGLRIPNLVTLGAVDSADRLTSFTNLGANIEVFANGHLVESYLPGGARVKWSGTSLAAPQLANLAAKMLALDPGLSPEDIMRLVRENADPLPGQPGRIIINPKRAIEALRRERGAR